MEIVNKSYITSMLKKLESISKAMPNSGLVESISLKKSLNRKLVENIYANNNYPKVEISEIEGKLLNIKENINRLDQFKKIEKDALGILALGENPFVVKTTNDFMSNIPAYFNIGPIGNTVITTEQYLPWFNAAFLKPNDGDILKEIKKGQGIISTGADYKIKDLVLKKDDVITNSKKALLRQAGIDKVNVYKDVKIAILCVDYELEYLNKNFELEYIVDCMKDWGYVFEIIKIKPFKNESVNRSIEDAEITINFNDYSKKLKKVVDEFDYIIACGLANNQYFNQLGLFRSMSFLNRFTDQGTHENIQFIGNYFKMMVGDLKGPIRKENLTFFNENGIPVSHSQKKYENRAILSYIPGYILDIIVNMHIFIKPTILSRQYGQPFQPEWKIGVLSQDFDSKLTNKELKNKILWAHATDIIYSNNGEINMKEVSVIKILDMKNERPDRLDFMKDCNCFIPVRNFEVSFKKGNYFYYLNI